MEAWMQVVAVGVGATAVMDLGAVARRKLLGTAPPDYGLVGRWIAHMPSGRFRHERIALAAAVRWERPLGWIAHYAIGIAFAALLAFVFPGWLSRPTILPAIAIGLATVLAPFLLMQPCMGAGFFASRAPRPAAARLQSLANHAVFGVGLFAAGFTLALFDAQG